MNKLREKHNMYKSPEYFAWGSMVQRCTNQNNSAYKNYGGRGIKVCDEWLNSFVKFYEDVGKRPSHLHSIDRIDNDGNYEPGNVRWATRPWQQINQRIPKRNTSGRKGVHFHKAKKKWQAYISINRARQHLGYFNSLENAYHVRNSVQQELAKYLDE